VHHIYSTFKSKETCVEIYLHLSRIYSEVKDVHPIYSTFKSEETCVEIIFICSTDGHTFKILPMDHHLHSSYRWTCIFILLMDHLHLSYRKRCYLFSCNFVSTNEFHLCFFENIQEDAFSVEPQVRTTSTRTQHNVEPLEASPGSTSTTFQPHFLYKGHVFGQNWICQFLLSTISFINHIQRKGQLLTPNFGLTFSKFVTFKFYLFNSTN